MTGLVDSHFHIWRQADLPWLLGPMQPRIFGPYEPIRRDYPIAEYLGDCRPAGVTQAVYVQANWATDRYLDEVAYVSQASDETGFPIAIVAYADMLAQDARPQLDLLARNARVRGVRMQLHWHENTLYRFASGPDLARDPSLIANVGRLAEYGFSFDLQVFAGQMAGAAELAAACPKVTFVLQHAGMLEDLSPEGIAAWREGMRLLAAQPNIVSKLSGLGTFQRRNDPEQIAFIIGETLALFGPKRCLFGSNFPIEKLWTSYAELIAAHRAAVPQAALAAVFNETARRVYRLGQ
ncbi:amidohydrolase family protein [Bosea sp. (in: a-proteobacteria)]|jgi:predicted TIM-barrel fold metal-dependent hydrolase|uniref:amidohydrolase family protein n=1 Tax=Bosea sp. (in: a-proteobacteria) TaxID=1871050 RepID=UPI002DDD876C|nr:amidohydrolase family protein [Bosea sp. (in: a-proteobacteria)]HEV2511553.1 amidohydrolase family protein [Bosea sp. (in: a-proteobacteria)]